MSVAVLGLAGAVALGIAGIVQVGAALIPFMLIGPLLVVGYNFELFGGVLHNDLGLAAGWGAFPVLTAYVAQTGRLAFAPVVAGLAALSLTVVQRTLSTPARLLRRRSRDVTGSVALTDDTVLPLDRQLLLQPLEQALRAMSWGIVLLATAIALARLT